MDNDIQRRRAKVLKMPKRGSGTEGKVLPVTHDGPEHIMRYPRVQRGDYYADFMRDKRVYPEVYHCVIQREGSNEIHSWIQDSTLEATMKQAETTLALILGSSVVAKRKSGKGNISSGRPSA